MRNQAAPEGRTEFKQVIRALKKQLKIRKIPYRKLATLIGMSESGVKKLFTAEDCSFQKLSLISQVAGVRLADLLIEKDATPFTDVEYTLAQQEYFLAHMDCFQFYWKLVYERIPLSDIEKESGLSPRESFRYLRKLDQLGLLTLREGGRPKLPSIKRVRQFGDGPLVRKLYRDWSLQAMQDLAKPKLEKDELFIIRYFKLRRDSYLELQKAMKELEAGFLQRAVREMILHDEGLVTVRWISAIDQRSFVGKIAVGNIARRPGDDSSAQVRRRRNRVIDS